MQTLHANTVDNSNNIQIPCKSYGEPHTYFLFFGFIFMDSFVIIVLFIQIITFKGII